MIGSPIRHAAVFLAFTTLVPVLLLGCPKKEPAVEDAGPPPAPPALPDVTELAPLTDDAGPDVGAPEAGKKLGGGGGYNSNQLKIKACCNAMRAQAKQMGSSTEAFQINALAAQCDMFVTQVGPQGNAPELNQLREILKSIKLPSACQM
ncbi:MAG TPA: hypothetical protein VH137_10510 [Gemmatimonadales bacterium]|nr:hypothetical protein [Gemmatimonadales bacterium]